MDMQKLQGHRLTLQSSSCACFRPVQAGYSVPGCARTQPNTRHVLVSMCNATSGIEPAPPRGISRMFQQHKLLMEAGFNYDQASLILEITERRAAPQATAAGMGGDPPSPDTPQLAAAANSCSPTANSNDSTSSSMLGVKAEQQQGQQQGQQQQQQQPGLQGVEDRLSFLELELLKLTLQPGDQQQLMQGPAADNAAAPSSSPGTSATSPGLATAAGYGGPAPWGWPGYDAAESPDNQLGHGLLSQPELLDPEVLAIAEALLIRKGLPYSTAAFATPPGWQGQFQQRQQQQQRGLRTPSGVRGRRRAAQQLRAKPRLSSGEPSAEASMQRLMAYGRQPNNDASLVRNRGASSSGRSNTSGWGNGGPGSDGYYGPNYPAGYEQGDDGLVGRGGVQAGADLTPYEPTGWAVAGTLAVVYAGVLLTFCALLAGAGDVGAAVDPADVALWW